MLSEKVPGKPGPVGQPTCGEALEMAGPGARMMTMSFRTFKILNRVSLLLVQKNQVENVLPISNERTIYEQISKNGNNCLFDSQK